jgi:hypothetical protein
MNKQILLALGLLTLGTLVTAQASQANGLYTVDQTDGIIGQYNSSTGQAINSNFITGITLPSDIAFDSTGNLYVTCWAQGETPSSVAKYDQYGNLINPGFLTSGVSDPAGIAIYNSSMYVVQNGNNYVSKYDLNGTDVNPLVSG